MLSTVYDIILIKCAIFTKYENKSIDQFKDFALQHSWVFYFYQPRSGMVMQNCRSKIKKNKEGLMDD